MAESQIPVVSKLTLDRTQWQSDLRASVSDLQSTAREISGQQISVSVVVDDQLTKAVEEILADLGTRELVIPVRFQQVGDLPGGGSSPLAGVIGAPPSAVAESQAAQRIIYNSQPLASVLPSAGGDAWDESGYTTLASAGGVAAAVSPDVPLSRVEKENAENEARFNARAMRSELLASDTEAFLGRSSTPDLTMAAMADEESAISRGSRETMGGMTDAEKAERFAREVNEPDPDRYVPGPKDIESAAEGPLGEAGDVGAETEAGAAGAAGPKLLNRFVAMQLARIPIEHLEQQLEARSKLDQVTYFGSVTQERKADEKVLETDSSGIIGQLSRPYNAVMGYDPAGELKDMREQDARISRGEMVNSAVQDTQTSSLRTAAYQTDDSHQRRELDREAAFKTETSAARAETTKKFDEQNFGGQQQAAYEKYQSAMVDAKSRGPSYDASEGKSPFATDHAEDGMRRQALKDQQDAEKAANDQYKSELARISRDRQKIEDELSGKLGEAQARKDAGQREDDTSRAVSDIRANAANENTLKAASDQLDKALGAGPEEEIKNFAATLQRKIKELNDQADVKGLDPHEAQKFRDQAAALKAAAPKEIEAREEIQRQKDTLENQSIETATAKNDIERLKLQGDTLGAARETIYESAKSQTNAAITKYGRGELDESQLAGTLANIKEAQGLGEQQIEKNEVLRDRQLQNELNESSIVSPYARRKQALADQTDIEEMRDPSHSSYLRQIQQEKSKQMDRDHDRQVADIQGQAKEIDLRSSGKGGLADVFAMQRHMKDELAENEGDPSMQAAIRDKYLSQAKAAEKQLQDPTHISFGSPTQMLLQSQQAIFDGIGAQKAVQGFQGFERNIKADQDRHRNDPGGGAPNTPFKGLENAGDAMSKAADTMGRAGQKILDAPEIFVVA